MKLICLDVLSMYRHYKLYQSLIFRIVNNFNFVKEPYI